MRDENRTRSNLRTQGPLLWAIWGFITLWKRYVVLWGWTPLFDRSQTPARHRRTIMDFCWGGMLLASASSFRFFQHAQTGESYQTHREILSALAAFASFRSFDLLVNAAAYAPFGPENWGGRYRNRDEHCRVMVLTVMNFLELIFWYSILFAYQAWFCGGQFIYPGSGALPMQPFVIQHAFLLAMSTITTLGYGTVAPNDMLTTITAGFETISGLLLITVGIASAVSFAVSSSQPTAVSEQRSAAVPDLLSRSWTIRCFSPLVCSAGLLIGLFWILGRVHR